MPDTQAELPYLEILSVSELRAFVSYTTGNDVTTFVIENNPSYINIGSRCDICDKDRLPIELVKWHTCQERICCIWKCLRVCV